jgi:hypothetical protein
LRAFHMSSRPAGQHPALDGNALIAQMYGFGRAYRTWRR